MHYIYAYIGINMTLEVLTMIIEEKIETDLGQAFLANRNGRN